MHFLHLTFNILQHTVTALSVSFSVLALAPLFSSPMCFLFTFAMCLCFGFQLRPFVTPPHLCLVFRPCPVIIHRCFLLVFSVYIYIYSLFQSCLCLVLNGCVYVCCGLFLYSSIFKVSKVHCTSLVHHLLWSCLSRNTET